MAERRAGGHQYIPRPDAWQAGPAAPWGHLDPQSVADRLTLDRVLVSLANRPPGAIDHAPEFPGARPSAVLVALADGDQGAEVVLTRRAQHMRNHRGEISFPGGRLDADEDAVSGALREAFEEVLLPPSSVEVVAELAHLSTVVSRSYIVPIVGRITEPTTLVPSPHEVDRVLSVPLVELAREDTFREERWGTPPLDRPIHFFELDDETVWGVTGRILYDLLTVLTA